MQWWEEIRSPVLRHGMSKRQVMRETGIHWVTLRRVMTDAEPPGYRRNSDRP